MPMAARLGDKHRCDRHGVGPILPTCCPTVLIGDRPAARLGDPTDGGAIIEGFPTVWIGAARGAGCLLAAAAEGAPFIEGDG